MADTVQPKLTTLLFRQPSLFIAGATSYTALPTTPYPEIAFIGRSNVGKSSLINQLLGRKKLARTSKKPGRTSQINLFQLGSQLVLADLPGYGYASVSNQIARHWPALCSNYLQYRLQLLQVVLLVDARCGLRNQDRDLFTYCQTLKLSIQLVLTKSDKLKPVALLDAIKELELAYATSLPVIATAANNIEGAKQLKHSIIERLNLAALRRFTR